VNGNGGKGRPLPSYVLRFIFGLMDNVFFLCSCLADRQLRASVLFIIWLLWFFCRPVVVFLFMTLRIYQYLLSVFSFLAQVSRG